MNCSCSLLEGAHDQLRWFDEDKYRCPAVLGGLDRLTDALANALVYVYLVCTHRFKELTTLKADITPIITSPTSNARIKKWVKLTEIPFDPFEAAVDMKTREVACPDCSRSQLIGEPFS